MEVAKLEWTQSVAATTRQTQEQAAPVEVVDAVGEEVAVGVVGGAGAAEVEAATEMVEEAKAESEAGVMPR
jgi:hypothetical protein